MSDNEYTPDKQHTTHIFCDWQSLDQEIGWEGPEEITKIENSGNP
jgi:hypothetical protein